MKQSTLLVKIDTFLSDNLGIWYIEPWIGSFECVWGVKKYSKEVFNIILWSFGGTAYTWWLNKNNTFDLKVWNRVEYTPWMQPPVWSIVFFCPTDSNAAWHTWFCRYRLKNPNKIALVEQNGIAWGKNQPWDEFNIRIWNLNNCLGRYTPKLDTLLPND